MPLDPGDVHLLVIAKQPVAGRVKTRLTPPYTPEEAAVLAEAALRDTLTAVAATPAAARTVVLSGDVGPWLPAGFGVVPQVDGGLDERLAAAFDSASGLHAGPALLVGMDTPQLSPDLLARSCSSLVTPGTDAVLGPATDGGWWALGLRRADPALLLGIPMSTADTGRRQLDRLQAAGLSVTMLAELEDVDDAASAAAVARLAPDTRFAATVRELAVRS